MSESIPWAVPSFVKIDLLIATLIPLLQFFLEP